METSLSLVCGKVHHCRVTLFLFVVHLADTDGTICTRDTSFSILLVSNIDRTSVIPAKSEMTTPGPFVDTHGLTSSERNNGIPPLIPPVCFPPFPSMSLCSRTCSCCPRLSPSVFADRGPCPTARVCELFPCTCCVTMCGVPVSRSAVLCWFCCWLSL